MNNILLQSDLWINGEWVKPSSGKYIEDRNPHDDSVYSHIASATPEDVDRAVILAETAFKANKHRLAHERELWLLKAADLVERDRKEYLDLLIDEVGSPIFKAEFEVNFCINALRAFASVPRRIRGEIIPSETPDVFSMAIRSPVGVIAAISPFNVPLLKVTKQCAMPIACGNAVVQMPSEHASQVSVKFAKTLEEAGLPAGLFNVVTGNPFEIGDTLTGHKKVNAITFCGSPVVGKHVAQIAAKDLKPITLELGGKSPLIVLDDADIDAAVQAAVVGVFFFQGQACMASSRIFLQKGIAEEFTAKYVEAAKHVSMGDLRAPDTFVGPIISKRQRDRVRAHIEDAKAKGVEVLAGGGWDGNRCQPTILQGVDESMEVCRNETFGPVTSLYQFDTVDEAMERANDSDYGLSFSVFTRDIEKALSLAQQAEAGAVHINRMTIQDEPNPPFGGSGLSGMGREGTEAELDTFTEWKWVTVNNPNVLRTD
ncbi:aldehyde dehydrogenase family protein [Rhodobacteraceae bacterium Araon29]